ncbi:MAG TPA: hypothetical protein VK879_05505 [Candidatus Sulfomarinibacteraceae bacterium]|nr:hypothetical protein [Candidatus Sulfomarinibacteraceae bacterium]
MESAIIVLLITLFLILVFILGPEIWRRLAQRNIEQQQELNATLAEVAGLLRAAAGRLRPFRELEADLFRERYRSAREQLQEAVDHYREVANRLAEVTIYDVDVGPWAFPHFLNHPEDAINIPRNALRLRRLQNDVAQVRRAVSAAESRIGQVEETPLALRRATGELADQRLPQLADLLADEEAAGIEALDDLSRRLEELRAETTTLKEEVRDRPSGDLPRLDQHAQQWVALQKRADELESNLEGVRNQRQSLDHQLQQMETTRDTVTNVSNDESVRDGVQPLLAYATERLDRARALRRRQKFAEATEEADEAQSVLTLARQLALAAEKVRQLLEVADISLHAEAIEVLSRRLYTAFRAAYDLVGAESPEPPDPIAADAESADVPRAGVPSTGVAETIPAEPEQNQALDGLLLRVDRLVAEAERLQKDHETSAREVQEEADRAGSELGQAWQALQQVTPLPARDPVALHYRQLLQEKSNAEGNPIQLQSFMENAQTLTADLKEARQTLERGLQRVEALRGELPQLLEKAEAEAGNWRCLQPYVQEMKESTATIWQITGSDVQLAEMQETLAELDLLEEQARAAYAALSGERKRLAVWEQRVQQARQARSQQATSWTGAGLRRLSGQVEAQITSARSAETVEAARTALQDALALLQDDWPDNGEE